MRRDAHSGVQLMSCLRLCGVSGGGFWPLCRSATIIIAVIVVCFFAEEYITFGMWDAANFTEITKCNELIYNFEPAGDDGSSIFSDTKLMKSCGVLRTNHSAAVQLSYEMFGKNTEKPVLRTKCGQKTGRLISYYTPREKVDVPPEKVVPNIVHYVSIGHWEFTFLNYLSFRSVDNFIKPQYIFIHGDALPRGQWWEILLREVPNMFFVKRGIPQRIQGRKTRWLEHSSDIMRLQTILDNGGIYLDTDILVLKSFDPLRQYDVTLGRESSFGLGSGIIVAKPSAPFVCMWFNVFRDYNPFPWNWATYAVHTPHKLAKVLPRLIHIEKDTLHRPSFEEPEKLFSQRVDWSKSYAVHVWKRYGTVPTDPSQIKNLNTTLGEIMRYVYATRT